MEKLSKEYTASISGSLIRWYEINKRDLPWRDTTDPYTIWVSEIILQQTRVNQGYNYFLRFTDKFPDVKSLALADEQEVLKLWEGLGYYSRARNMHAAAKEIYHTYGGKFPDIYEQILGLKGIGTYTAAAIASFSYDLPYPVLDGNVFRVLSRLFAEDTPIDTGEGKKKFTYLAEQLIDKNNPGTYNQAIMEFGALQCVPVNPDCRNCPFSSHCLALAQERVAELPKKKGKTAVKERFFNYLDIQFGDYTFIRKREENDIWKNLYEFPLIETDEKISLEKLLEHPEFEKLFGNLPIVNVELKMVAKHVLSHRIIHTTFYKIEIQKNISDMDNYEKIRIADRANYPFSRLINKYLEKMQNTLF